MGSKVVSKILCAIFLIFLSKGEIECQLKGSGEEVFFSKSFEIVEPENFVELEPESTALLKIAWRIFTWQEKIRFRITIACKANLTYEDGSGVAESSLEDLSWTWEVDPRYHALVYF